MRGRHQLQVTAPPRSGLSTMQACSKRSAQALDCKDPPGSPAPLGTSNVLRFPELLASQLTPEAGRRSFAAIPVTCAHAAAPAAQDRQTLFQLSLSPRHQQILMPLKHAALAKRAAFSRVQRSLRQT